MRPGVMVCIELAVALSTTTSLTSVAQQLATRASAPTQWVSFVAEAVEETRTQYGRATVSGIYVRNKEGSSYRRIVARFKGPLPLVGATDQGILYLRPLHVSYHIDYGRKVMTRQEVDIVNRADLRPDPITRDEFMKEHATDEFLGTQMISGVECEGYRIHRGRKWKKSDPEGWFAPSLNFLVFKAKRFSDLGEVTDQIENIEIEKDPDPLLFRLPEGFSLMK